MSRGRRTSIGGQFAPRRIDMLRSPAYCVLSLSARRVLDRLEIELADHGGADNGKLPCTYQDFVNYGLHRHAIYPAIQEVVALGFVEITEQGVAGSAEFRKPNLFRLTYRNSAGLRGDGTHEWMKITEEEAPLIAAAARSAKPIQKQNLKYEKRQSSVRKPHREAALHSTETVTTAHSTETITTIDISSVDADKARGARPLRGAVASGPGTPERTEVIQNRIAQRLGADGWLKLSILEPSELDQITAKEAAGELGRAELLSLFASKSRNESAA